MALVSANIVLILLISAAYGDEAPSHSHHSDGPGIFPPPTSSPRKKIAVQGVVYCKSCKYRGIDTLLGATPLLEAVVKLHCNNTKAGMTELTKTNKNGYFLFMPQKVTNLGYHKCRVYIVSSPLTTCNVTTNFHGGVSGAVLTPASGGKPQPFVLFNVGPFAFEPDKKLPCN